MSILKTTATVLFLATLISCGGSSPDASAIDAAYNNCVTKSVQQATGMNPQITEEVAKQGAEMACKVVSNECGSNPSGDTCKQLVNQYK